MRSAIELWTQEIKRKERTITQFDDLWRAACEELNARHCRAMNLTDAAGRSFKESDRLLRLYFKAKRREQRDRDNGFEQL